MRLDRGFLSSDDQQRLQEIKVNERINSLLVSYLSQDELEANDAEIQLNQLHLLSLTKNHEKSPPESSSTVGSPSSVLYEEISRDILETLGSNPWGSSWNIEFISSLLHEIVEHRLKYVLSSSFSSLLMFL